MATPTRFPNGVTNNKASNPMKDLPVLDPTRVHEFFDDFDAFTISASDQDGWHLDATGTPTAAIVDADGGQVSFTTDTTAAGANAHYQWARNTDVSEIFKFESGKKSYLKTRFKVSEATTCLPQVGLHIAADDPWNSEPSDQFLFRTLAADPDALEFAAGKTAATEVTVSLGNLADDTFVELVAFYDGKDSVHVSRADANGVVTNVGTADVTDTTTGDLLPDTEMTVAAGVEATTTGGRSITLDYLYVAKER